MTKIKNFVYFLSKITMTENEFIKWVKGYTEGVHEFSASPKQWQHLKEVLKTVGKTSYADYSTGNWVMSHTWE
tara:strand:- start:930 stop:1148 length:219 start_codon:yes stop_codon:yes gene_type:complete